MAGVTTVVGTVVGAAGESAVKEAPDATLRSNCRSDVRDVSAVGVWRSVPSVSESTCPGILSSRGGAGEPLFGVECRGVAEAGASMERRVTVPVPVRFVDAVSLRSLRFALIGGLLTSLVPRSWRARTGTAASELSSARSSVA